MRITRKEYMKNSSELHHAYYLQFATANTRRFVLNSLTVEQIKEALKNGDEHLNKIKIPFNHMGSGGNWWWDYAPINNALLKELGESYSPSTCTCVSKAIAKELTKQKKIIMTKYQQAKQQLKHAAKVIKKDFPKDKPAQRMYINDTRDAISKDYYYKLTEHQNNLLSNYASTLHPK